MTYLAITIAISQTIHEENHVISVDHGTAVLTLLVAFWALEAAVG